MFSEIWGSKSETYEGINDHDEKINKSDNQPNDNEDELKWIDNDQKYAIAMGNKIVEISKEIMKIIEENYDLLCIDKDFKIEKFDKYKSFSKLSGEVIAEKQMISTIENDLTSLKRQLEELKSWCNRLKNQVKVELGSNIIEKAKEVVQFIERKYHILCLNTDFLQKDFTEIQMIAESDNETITENLSYKNMKSKTTEMDNQLKTLQELYEQVKKQILSKTIFIIIMVGHNYSTQIESFLSQINDSKLKEEYNDKYVLIIDKMLKEYSITRDRVNCRNIFLNFYKEIALLIQIQQELNLAYKTVDKYNKKPNNPQKMYLSEKNYIDVSEYELKVCELLLIGNFESLAKEATKKTETRIISVPGIDQYSKPITKNVRKTETKIIPNHYKLNPELFFEKNAEIFCHMLTSYNSDTFIISMEVFIEKLKNNQIKDNSDKIIKTYNIGLSMEKEFIVFLIVNLYRIKDNKKINAYNYIQKKLKSNKVDLKILFIMLDMKSLDETGCYDNLINYQISLMTPEEKEMFYKYLNVSHTKQITRDTKVK